MHLSGARSLVCFVLPALLQQVVGEFSGIFTRNFCGNLAGILRDFSDPEPCPSFPWLFGFPWLVSFKQGIPCLKMSVFSVFPKDSVGSVGAENPWLI